MKRTRYFAMVAFAIAILLLGSRLVGAQSQVQQVNDAGGGMITGSVLGFDMYNRLEPIMSATVYADDGQHTFVTHTSGGGYYEMYVPQGTYNVTVEEPGYSSYSSTVIVAPGSTSTIDVYMEQSHVPVPEFPSGIVSTLTMLTLTAVLIATRRNKRKG